MFQYSENLSGLREQKLPHLPSHLTRFSDSHQIATSSSRVWCFAFAAPGIHSQGFLQSHPDKHWDNANQNQNSAHHICQAAPLGCLPPDKVCTVWMSEHLHSWSQTSKWDKRAASNFITHYAHAKATFHLFFPNKKHTADIHKRNFKSHGCKYYSSLQMILENGAGRSEVGNLTPPWKSCWAQSGWSNLSEDWAGQDLIPKNFDSKDYSASTINTYSQQQHIASNQDIKVFCSRTNKTQSIKKADTKNKTYQICSH